MILPQEASCPKHGMEYIEFTNAGATDGNGWRGYNCNPPMEGRCRHFYVDNYWMRDRGLMTL